MNDYQSVVQSQFLVGKGGQMVEHLVRVGTSHCRAFIDQLTYVVDLDALSVIDGQVLFSEILKYQEVDPFQMFKYLVHLMSEKMIEIFGFGVTDSGQLDLISMIIHFNLAQSNVITAMFVLVATVKLYAFLSLQQDCWQPKKAGKNAFMILLIYLVLPLLNLLVLMWLVIFFNCEYNIISMLND